MKAIPEHNTVYPRDANGGTTMGLYVHANVDAKLAAQQQMMETLLRGTSATVN